MIMKMIRSQKLSFDSYYIYIDHWMILPSVHSRMYYDYRTEPLAASHNCVTGICLSNRREKLFPNEAPFWFQCHDQYKLDQHNWGIQRSRRLAEHRGYWNKCWINLCWSSRHHWVCSMALASRDKAISRCCFYDLMSMFHNKLFLPPFPVAFCSFVNQMENKLKAEAFQFVQYEGT